MSKICGLFTDHRIFEYAIKNNCTIFGVKATKYRSAIALRNAVSVALKNNGLETYQEWQENKPNKPTHSDVREMLRDMYAYSQLNSKSQIIADDDPFCLLCGFIVFWKDGAKDISKQFYIHLRDVRAAPKKILSAFCKDRAEICDKERLKKLVETEDE
jgi:hypothetical protein